MPAEQYSAVFREAGLEAQCLEDHSETLMEIVLQTQSKLLGAEILDRLKKIEVPGMDLGTTKQFAKAAMRATRDGVLGYTVIVASKPLAKGSTVCIN